ncbi:hypothetical protein R2R35_18395 [Anaerocolumna sp. AGMB13020]|uniref:hypothetical protein n=1 Tax=Anaerocolumna sp. AGMB13020 TaxID=3081750 RepID=UPI0029540114|nr:hypothetical protein [Anaerocolumna sp. AGMB13020]WOO35751.1 hypothetical protein R2R35_18395 [Anaerocolumna sp. AGMB13020]
MDKYFFDNEGNTMYEFKCNIVMDKELQNIHDKEKKCKQHNLIIISIGIAIGLFLVPIVFFLQHWFFSDWISDLRMQIFGCLVMISPFCLLIVTYVSNDLQDVDSKYYNRVELINLIPQIDELLEISSSSGGMFEYDDFLIHYTNKDDSRKIVSLFILEGYRLEKSRAVSCLTFDIDNFTLQKPY